VDLTVFPPDPLGMVPGEDGARAVTTTLDDVTPRRKKPKLSSGRSFTAAVVASEAVGEVARERWGGEWLLLLGRGCAYEKAGLNLILLC
jgi:hypothetical protein